ncbi:MAG TPA: transcriptional repressor LexA [Phycisphaerae bacterium]|jgi:repressor LexA
MRKPLKSKPSGSHRLTPRQMQILRCIRNTQRSRGYSPTMQELADELGVSKVTVFEHVEALIDKGFLRRAPHKARSLELTPQVQFPDERPTCVPLAGRIAAGAPIEAIEDRESVDLEDFVSSRHETFVLQVAGDSMIEDHICDGDYVIVEKRQHPNVGDTIVALLENGEATLKRFYREGHRIRLQPANKKYKPIYTDRVDVQGIVVGVLRRYR